MTIKDETNKLIDRCYTKGSRDLMVFQRQKFLNELFPLLDSLGVRIVKVSPGVYPLIEPLICCSICKKEPCTCPSINRGSFAKYVEEGVDE